MTQHYQRRQVSTGRRQSTTLPVFLRDLEDENLSRRPSISVNLQRRLSTVSQLYLTHGGEYHSQAHVPRTGLAAQQSFLVTSIDDAESSADGRRLSSISHRFLPIHEHSGDSSNESDADKLSGRQRNVLFAFEPIISGLLLFPILVLFWECGWNLVLILLNWLNKFPLMLHLEELDVEDYDPYTNVSMWIPYLIAQVILVVYYLGQEAIYNFLRARHWLVRAVLLKLHIFVLASVYVVQWEMIWTIWDQSTPHEWYFEFAISLTSLFALIVFTGHLADLVCAPFVLSYDSVEYCVFIGCPLLTRETKTWQVNAINYILYEILISNLSIMTWRGFYHLLDEYLCPDDPTLSAGICLIIGYALYFPLMYFQTYLENLDLTSDFWTFVSLNFPWLYRNIRHLLAFLSCVFLWRGFWMLYDNYVYIFEDYHLTYLLLYIVCFFVLSLLQTASSTNGPLSDMEDVHNFFPLYPHSYVSTVQRKLAQLPFFQPKLEEENTSL